jgi:Domain of Unknown Function (DUF748)
MAKLKLGFLRRRWRWLLGLILFVVVLVGSAAFLIDEQLRRTMERELNNRLVGYSVRISQVDFHPIGFSLDLEQVTITQDANPDPPVAIVPRLSASVQWSEIIFGRLVANFSVDEPTLYINQAHFRREVSDPVAFKQRGWQEALQAIYPLKINEFTVTGATLTYVDDTRFPPLHLSHVTMRATNIRNIRAPERTYPSSIEVTAVVFGTGRASLTGQADFLATPHLGVKADIALNAIALPYFQPILAKYGVRLQGGRLSAAGQVEYAPWVRTVELTEATVAGVRADYVQDGTGRARAEAVRRGASPARGAPPAKETAKTPETAVRIGQFRLVQSELGFANETTTPNYRVFVADAQLHVSNLASPRAKDMAVATLTGRFMGSGQTAIQARFRPAAPKADFRTDVKIENTDLSAMNNLLRAHGKFDVVGGVFSVYSELAVQGNEVRGYVKPLFRDVKVYDASQDRHKPALRKLYERIVQGASKVLENRPRDEVATRVEISGRVEQPDTGTLAAVLRLIQNAFFVAILPGFDQQVPRSSRS